MGREKARQRLAIRKAFAPKKRAKHSARDGVKRSTKATDVTQKKHRFESFSQRVSRITIDPIRRDRGRDDALDSLESHFRVALDKWRDLNMSEDFTRFARKVNGMCENLPQVLHHQSALVEALLENIDRATAVSAEPFLDLISHLAQDLQAQFAERHFEGTVKIVAAVAARHQDVEVVEWCFNCLTWLFKYLERILAADILPLYDLLAPYLGKQRQRPFVSRFAAESLSFLVKRVGKRRETAEAFVAHAFTDLEETARERDTELYENSLIALFLEAIRGVRETLHSTGSTIFTAFLNQVIRSHQTGQSSDAAERVLRGLFFQAVHQISAPSIQPLFDAILDASTPPMSDAGSRSVIMTAQLLLIGASVKSGARITQWKELMKALGAQIDQLTQASPDAHKTVATSVLATLAIAHQNCPLDVALSASTVLDKICSSRWQTYFPGFCNLYAQHGGDRFQSFILPRLQKFLTTCWDGQTRPMLLLIPGLLEAGLVSKGSLKLPSSLDSSLVGHSPGVLNNHGDLEVAAASQQAYLHLCKSVAIRRDLLEVIRSQVCDFVEQYMSRGPVNATKALAVGDAFLYLTEDIESDELDRLLSLAASAAPNLTHLPAFFRALAACVGSNRFDLRRHLPDMKSFASVLIPCLSSSSHEIRLASLQILAKTIEDESLAEHINSAINVENTPPSLETARFISMKIKNLGMHYRTYSINPTLAVAIPTWLFGLLHVKFAQVWEDACSALKDISQTKAGEAVILDVAFRWLEESPVHELPRDDDELSEDKSGLRLDNHFSRLEAEVLEPLTIADRVNNILLSDFKKRHETVAELTPFNRTQALKVLKFMPHLAEKKARQLVPVLLAWSSGANEDLMPEHTSEDIAGEDDVAIDDAPGDYAAENSPDQDTAAGRLQWNRKDYKALLGLFATFSNPRSLCKSDEVYGVLLQLLSHGDAEIQKSALHAVLAWKDKTLRKYSEELLKILDDARLREQLSVFLDGGGDNGLVKEDRVNVMPIALRLVYGRLVARTRNDRSGNRRAVFVILAKYGAGEVNIFLDITIGTGVTDAGKLPPKRQLGMLNMIKDMLETWRSTAEAYIPRLAPIVVECLFSSVKGSSSDSPATVNIAKAVRQVALQCLNLCFEANNDEDLWTPFMDPLFREVVSPRLDNFAAENAQGVSTLLQMFAIWAQTPLLTQNLFDAEERQLRGVIGCIALPFAKEQVKRFVINDILAPLVSQVDTSPEVRNKFCALLPHILTQIASSVPQITSKELTEDTVALVVAMMPHTDALSCPVSLLSAAADLVLQASKKVPHRTKGQLLSIISYFFPSIAEDETTQQQVFASVCSSFAYFSDAQSRTSLVNIAKRFAQYDTGLEEIIALLDDINSFEPGRLDLPDYERRSKAFARIHDRCETFGTRQWRLMLGNLMFYIKDNEELAIRASASQALKGFVDSVASTSRTEEEQEEMAEMLRHLLGGIERGLKDQSELVQAELLSVLAALANLPDEHNPISDFKHLLMGGDEEAGFFTNILHVQQHRRVRALGRLVNIAQTGVLNSRNVYRYLLPLIEGFVFKKTAGDMSKAKDGVLAGEAVRCIGGVFEWLDWQQCRVLLARYIGYIKSKEEEQETALKLLDTVAAGFARAGAETVKPLNAADGEDVIKPIDTSLVTKLSQTMPGRDKLSVYTVEELLPPLQVFLRNKDESFVSRRIAVAMVAAKLVQVLPEVEFRTRFPPLLTDVCYILRSKDQGSRDATRKALSSIVTLVGPSAFEFVVKELRGALLRGFYLHVLAFSVHSILEATLASFKTGDLDYCVPSIVDVIIEDIFGNTGKEKDMQEYKADKQTKKEVKGKKSFDTMQLLASITSLQHLIQLVRPIQSLLLGSLTQKEVRYAEELLRRIELGVVSNKELGNTGVLRFCWEIVQEAHKYTPSTGKYETGKKNGKSSAGLVDSAYLIRNAKTRPETALHASEATGKITRFALETVRSVLKKNKELAIPANIDGFMPVLGDALLSTNEDVKLASIRLFTAVLNVPLPRIDRDAPVYIAEAAKVIEEAQATGGGELEQACLKLISTVLRERKSAPVKVKPATIALLLKRMRGDLQVISQQGVAFNLLRSIISRQIVVPEIYELMDGTDGVAAISVRDHDRTTRDLARGVYFQFLMDYPQGPGRWAKQLQFLKRNLEFEHAEGRRSVLDTCYLLTTKVGDALSQDVIKELFWSLVAVMVNDDDASCREMAAGVIKEIFKRASEEWISSFLELCQKLLARGNAVQQRTAMQSWALYLQVETVDAQGLDFMISAISTVLSAQDFDGDAWQLSYWSLHTFATITEHRPSEGFDAKASGVLWTHIARHINFPHAWVKTQATTLVNLLLKHLVRTPDQLRNLPLIGTGGIRMGEEELCDLTTRHLRLLRDGISQELAGLAVRNLAVFGNVFALNGTEWSKGAGAVKEVEVDPDDEFGGVSDEEMELSELAPDLDDDTTAITYLLRQLGLVIRREPSKAVTLSGPREASTLIPKTAALQLLSALTKSLSQQSLTSAAIPLLEPLVHLTSPTLTLPTYSTLGFKETHETLVTDAQELLDTLRTKLGTQVYVEAVQIVESGRRERREERRGKRRVEAITRPEVGMRKRVKRNERDKVRRKEGLEMRKGGRRGW